MVENRKGRSLQIIILLGIVLTVFAFISTVDSYAYGKSPKVAKVHIVADGTKPLGSKLDYGTHAFLYIENISKKPIKVLSTRIQPGCGITVGTYGNKDNGKGIYINLESFYIYNYGDYPYRVSLSKKITAKQLKKLDKKMKRSNKWSARKNCAWFALRCWRAIGGKKLKGGAIKTPKALSESIRTKKGWAAMVPIYVEDPYNIPVRRYKRKAEIVSERVLSGVSSSINQ